MAMPYMAVGSRQILFHDSQAPAMVRPAPAQPPNPAAPSGDPSIAQPGRPATPVQEEHLGTRIDIRA